MKHVALLLIPLTLSFIFSATGNAQQPRPQCPTISVSCPPGCPKVDKDLVFQARVSGGDSDLKPVFNWSVSSGTIISGQGTRDLTVRILNECDSVTGSVEIKGLPAECSNTASCTTITDCCGFLPPSRKFDEFGDIHCDDEMARLDAFRVQLENEPGALGYVVFYEGRLRNRRMAKRGEGQARANRIKEYLVERRGIDSARITMINGGYREQWGAELWIVPSGGNSPTPTPTLEKMKFRRGRVRKGEHNCRI